MHIDWIQKLNLNQVFTFYKMCDQILTQFPFFGAQRGLFVLFVGHVSLGCSSRYCCCCVFILLVLCVLKREGERWGWEIARGVSERVSGNKWQENTAWRWLWWRRCFHCFVTLAFHTKLAPVLCVVPLLEPSRSCQLQYFTDCLLAFLCNFDAIAEHKNEKTKSEARLQSKRSF